MAGESGASSVRLRTVVERPLRRLCIALKRFEEASATTRIRLVVASRSHELQALTPSRVVVQMAVSAMTDLISEDTVKRSSIGFPQSKPAHIAKKGKYLDSGAARFCGRPLESLA